MKSEEEEKRTKESRLCGDDERDAHGDAEGAPAYIRRGHRKEEEEEEEKKKKKVTKRKREEQGNEREPSVEVEKGQEERRAMTTAIEEGEEKKALENGKDCKKEKDSQEKNSGREKDQYDLLRRYRQREERPLSLCTKRKLQEALEFVKERVEAPQLSSLQEHEGIRQPTKHFAKRQGEDAEKNLPHRDALLSSFSSSSSPSAVVQERRNQGQKEKEVCPRRFPLGEEERERAEWRPQGIERGGEEGKEREKAEEEEEESCCKETKEKTERERSGERTGGEDAERTREKIEVDASRRKRKGDLLLQDAAEAVRKEGRFLLGDRLSGRSPPVSSGHLEENFFGVEQHRDSFDIDAPPTPLTTEQLEVIHSSLSLSLFPCL